MNITETRHVQCVCVCMYVYVCVCVCVCIYIYKHTRCKYVHSMVTIHVHCVTYIRHQSCTPIPPKAHLFECSLLSLSVPLSAGRTASSAMTCRAVRQTHRSCSGQTVTGLIQPLPEHTVPGLAFAVEESVEIRVCHRCALYQDPELSRRLWSDILQRPVAHIYGHLRVQRRGSECGESPACVGIAASSTTTVEPSGLMLSHCDGQTTF